MGDASGEGLEDRTLLVAEWFAILAHGVEGQLHQVATDDDLDRGIEDSQARPIAVDDDAGIIGDDDAFTQVVEGAARDELRIDQAR